MRSLLFSISIGVMISHPALVFAEETTGTFNLIQTIEAALKANLGLKQSKEDVSAALATKKARITNFLPTLNARYGYIRRDRPTRQALGRDGQEVDVIVNSDRERGLVDADGNSIFTGRGNRSGRR